MRFFPIEKFCQGAALKKHAQGVDFEANVSKIDGRGVVFELGTLKKKGSSGFQQGETFALLGEKRICQGKGGKQHAHGFVVETDKLETVGRAADAE